MGHASQVQLNKLVTKDLVIGLPKNKFKVDKVCEACTLGKQIKSSFKSKQMVSSTCSFELIHIDLCGPMRVQSRRGKRYVFVLVDDYTRYTWTLFLAAKDDAFEVFCSLMRKIQRKYGKQLKAIRSDHGTEFENSKFA